MGDLARNKFARLTAMLGLAAAITLGIAGGAGAAPADRGGDPVVMKGSELPTLDGIAPTQIVAYKWAGKWVQVPVQIDERHVVKSRSLYPDVVDSKYILNVPFDIEVYADPKTRSGADENTGFDADDELVFMGGDSGQAAPSTAMSPAGTVASTATRVKVDDPVGGGDAFVYLFKANGTPDQSAGKDYVDYSFKLTKLTAGQNMKDDYGYSNSTNPEDSTVKTANYELHSTGRWMEDEMKISAGASTKANILDREAVSAGGLGGCSRSEYTFSGNWDQDVNPGNDRPDDDDEGAYLAVKDGPVRALRAYIGANSGPFVEADHKYYADHEDKKIIVRVHPIPDMYVWTDYSEAAIGMTYRDQKNRDGVTIDGNPDTVTPASNDDFVSGKYLWQQVTGPQGSATSLVTAVPSVVDADNPPFTSYYLDDSTPTGSLEKQCGGDLKAYGASGFGIAGVFPNTDPILADAVLNSRDLYVSRIRYFGAPGATAADADALRDRVAGPLTAAAGKVSFAKPKKSVWVDVLRRRSLKARPGKVLRVKAKVRNNGNVTLKNTRVCLSGRDLGRRGCGRIATLAPGKSKLVALTAKVKKKVKGKRIIIMVMASNGGEGSGQGLFVRVKR